MSKHVGEKCGKLHITYILSSKRGITPSKIDAKWRNSNLICSTLKESDVQNFSSICQSMYEKSVENGRTETRTDGRRVGRTEGRTDGESDGDPDGHHHTIIRPVWRRAYNKVMCKISAQYVKACRRKVRKTGGRRPDGRTDGRTDGDPDGDPDGHHHTIIRPVWRRAYKNRTDETFVKKSQWISRLVVNVLQTKRAFLATRSMTRINVGLALVEKWCT